MTFFVPCIPPKTSHHRKRIVRHGRFSRLADAASLVEAKQSLDALLMPFRPSTPIPSPVRLEIAWVWPFLAKHSKRVRATGGVWHTARPDLSNVTKTLEDRLVRLRFIDDDAGVADARQRKQWGPVPGIRVTIEALSDDAIR